MAGRRSTDVVIVGGGVIGLATAWRAAASGRQVTLVDPEPGHGATWAAAGMLAPVGEANFGEDRLSALLVEAAGAWPRFAGELEAAAGATIGYRPDGTLLVAVDPSDRVAVADLLDYRREPRARGRRSVRGQPAGQPSHCSPRPSAVAPTSSATTRSITGSWSSALLAAASSGRRRRSSADGRPPSLGTAAG